MLNRDEIVHVFACGCRSLMVVGFCCCLMVGTMVVAEQPAVEQAAADDLRDEGWTDWLAKVDRVIQVRAGDNLERAMSSARAGTMVAIEAGTQWDQLPVPRSGWEGRPIVIAVYGDGPRPVFREGWNVFGRRSIQHVALVGLHFRKNAAAGMRILCNVNELTFEDCVFEDFDFVAHSFDGTSLANITLRRCIIRDRYHDGGGHIQGMFISDVRGLTIEQCLFDNNGHPATIFRHNLYSTGSRNVTIRDNIFSRAGNLGIKLRSERVAGSTNILIENNLFVGNGVVLAIGSETVEQNAFNNIIIRNNVATQHGRRIIHDQHMGMEVANAQAVRITNNRFVDSNRPGTSNCIVVRHGDDVVVRGNLAADWQGARFQPDTADNIITPDWDGPRFDQDWLKAERERPRGLWPAEGDKMRTFIKQVLEH